MPLAGHASVELQLFKLTLLALGYYKRCIYERNRIQDFDYTMDCFI